MRRLSILVLSLSLLGCKDDLNAALNKIIPPALPVQLPPETQIGANTAGCLLNGQTWEAASHGSTQPFLLPTPNALFDKGDLWLTIVRRSEVKSPLFAINIRLNHLRQPGIYSLGRQQPVQGSRYYSYAEVMSNSARTVSYVTDSVSTGILTVTYLDTASAKKVMSGRFEFRAPPTYGSSPLGGFPAEVIVTEGRFDVELNRP